MVVTIHKLPKPPEPVLAKDAPPPDPPPNGSLAEPAKPKRKWRAHAEPFAECPSCRDVHARALESRAQTFAVRVSALVREQGGLTTQQLAEATGKPARIVERAARRAGLVASWTAP
jgi:hypothetical protein